MRIAIYESQFNKSSTEVQISWMSIINCDYKPIIYLSISHEAEGYYMAQIDQTNGRMNLYKVWNNKDELTV